MLKNLDKNVERTSKCRKSEHVNGSMIQDAFSGECIKSVRKNDFSYTFLEGCSPGFQVGIHRT